MQSQKDNTNILIRNLNSNMNSSNYFIKTNVSMANSKSFISRITTCNQNVGIEFTNNKINT